MNHVGTTITDTAKPILLKRIALSLEPSIGSLMLRHIIIKHG